MWFEPMMEANVKEVAIESSIKSPLRYIHMIWCPLVQLYASLGNTACVSVLSVYLPTVGLARWLLSMGRQCHSLLTH